MELVNEQVELGPILIRTASKKTSNLASTLQLMLLQFKEVAEEYQQLHQNYYQLLTDYNKPSGSSLSCKTCLDLRENLAKKENIIQGVASKLTLLNETKNLVVLDEIFMLICGETATLTPKDSPKHNEQNRDTVATPVNERDESVSEIDGTPTGRTSPIIQSRKPRARINDSDASKKKCSNSWPIPEAKQAKLTLTPSQGSKARRTKQTRLNLIRTKPTNFVDLCSPGTYEKRTLETLVKNEPVDNEETIMPSPTSCPVKSEFPKYRLIYTSPAKKKQELVRIKTEVMDSPKKLIDDATEMENSINLFNPNRFKNSPSKFKKPNDISKLKKEVRIDSENITPRDNDETRIEESINVLNPLKFEPMSETFTQVSEVNVLSDTNVSLSILKRLEEIEKADRDGVKVTGQNIYSPSKRPLAENMNMNNVPTDTQASVSVLRSANTDRGNGASKTKIKTPEKPLPIYKEPTVRKKAERRALPGWSCENCKNFYSELYADNEEMLAQLMEECSKHRGRRDPAAPQTPPGYWDPRWTVPEDTEAFNARNGA